MTHHKTWESSIGPPGICLSPSLANVYTTDQVMVATHPTSSPSSYNKQSRGHPCPFYILVSAVSYSLSLSSSKMSTSTLALPSLSGARLMRFLARVMESRSPLLHSMGSSKIAAVGRQPQADSWYPVVTPPVPPGSHRCLLSGGSHITIHPAILRTVPQTSPLHPTGLGL